MPPPKQPGTAPLLKIGGVVAALIVLFLCMAIANSAKNKTHQNTNSRLELTRKRFEMCDMERRVLNGEKISVANEMQMAQDEYSALKSENDLLKEDNNELSLDIAELEKFVDNLREELDEKDFISDDEAQALEETLALGNNSKTLKDLLQSAAFSDESDIVVGKDELIGMLLSEMKLKRSSLLTCMNEKKVVGKLEGQLMWADMNTEQRNAVLRVQVKKIATLQMTQSAGSTAEANELIDKWGPRHYRGVEGLRDDVKARIQRKQSQAGRKTQGGADIDANMKMGPDEEDLMDDQWREWDWDAEEETF
jgi:uncharacterized protein (DUF3084 family)|eukprot:CAMPEP_0174301730 /NCGR_PEP_ID=MMETSP0809-20121228/59216_1 /TAXON_ID=73025 ORGANISM="Eutreptiella gymnastica-like, Strain CCMP1594" /NCGR_SAMPLE_ID=MMETSP0809 /ASSEMBLY_ACC=CAM_ASM_000658 /LENGTH=307 /DNA_ID=CAMNT_0015407523 /DNA_START=18 /DNA_END=941 /DNA_ORIENTATION=+